VACCGWRPFSPGVVDLTREPWLIPQAACLRLHTAIVPTKSQARIPWLAHRRPPTLRHGRWGSLPYHLPQESTIFLLFVYTASTTRGRRVLKIGVGQNRAASVETGTIWAQTIWPRPRPLWSRDGADRSCRAMARDPANCHGDALRSLSPTEDIVSLKKQLRVCATCKGNRGMTASGQRVCGLKEAGGPLRLWTR